MTHNCLDRGTELSVMFPIIPVDRLYEENKNLMAPQQYEAAKSDFEYFIRLIKLAEVYYDVG